MGLWIFYLAMALAAVACGALIRHGVLVLREGRDIRRFDGIVVASGKDAKPFGVLYLVLGILGLTVLGIGIVIGVRHRWASRVVQRLDGTDGGLREISKDAASHR